MINFTGTRYTTFVNTHSRILEYSPVSRLDDDARTSRATRLAGLLDQLSDQGMTQTEVADQLNVPPNYLSDVKRARRDLTDSFARSLAQTFGINVRWLLYGQGSAPRLKLATAGAARAATILLPVLSAPYVGDARDAPSWDGSMLEISGRAAAAAHAATNPYVLRAAEDDQCGRVHRDDLLLIDQTPLETQPEEALAIVRHQRRLRLARRSQNGWICARSGNALNPAAECVGLCVGIVWGPL
jgi:transcriptional regulator with XRE-family HTH domain